jgi:hypothetical protein
MHLIDNSSMPKKAKMGSCIGPFEAGKYKSPNPETYRSLCVCGSIVQKDVMQARVLARKKMKKGMTVQGKYMLGRYKDQWYDCVLVDEIEGGWTVAWCDGTNKDTRKKLEHIRLKRG